MDISPSDFIKKHHVGILSTQSQRYQGFPFGSLVPYVIASNGNIALYLSQLAEHTKNIVADNKVALTISEAEDNDNPASVARLTLLATAVVSKQQEGLREHYGKQFPDAKLTLTLPGFQFYELELVAIRLIAGFGDIHWLNPDTLDLRLD